MWELGVKRVVRLGVAWFCGMKPNLGRFAQKGEETAHFAKQTIFGVDIFAERSQRQAAKSWRTRGSRSDCFARVI
jgi:hypothetical protein